MSPSQFHDFHSNREITSSNNINNNNNNNTSLCPPPLKINMDSHFIKKSQLSSSSSSSATASSLVNRAAAPATKQQQRHPVIIYTHSPKVIHIQPRHFMALVQKLTGLPRSEENDGGKALPLPPKQEPDSDDNNDHKIEVVSDEDNETTSSVVTDDDDDNDSVGHNQVSSCFGNNPFQGTAADSGAAVEGLANLPVFTPNPAEFLLEAANFKLHGFLVFLSS